MAHSAVDNIAQDYSLRSVILWKRHSTFLSVKSQIWLLGWQVDPSAEFLLGY